MNYISDMRKYIGHRPMLSVGATIAVIKDNRILLNLRSDTATWGIPGGGTELGETVEQTAKRELKEETNLDCGSFTLLNVFSGKDLYFKYPNEDELYSVVVLYLANDVSGSLKITDGESIKLAYFSKDNLPKLENRANVIINWLIENKYIT